MNTKLLAPEKYFSHFEKIDDEEIFSIEKRKKIFLNDDFYENSFEIHIVVFCKSLMHQNVGPVRIKKPIFLVTSLSLFKNMLRELGFKLQVLLKYILSVSVKNSFAVHFRHVARSEDQGGASYTWGQKSGGVSSKGGAKIWGGQLPPRPPPFRHACIYGRQKTHWQIFV
jgi:hypothetical protein